MDTHNDQLPHKDFYRNLRAHLQHWAGNKGLDSRYSEYVLLLPDLLHLLPKLILNHRISRKNWVILGVATAYIISPVDAIPEALVGRGIWTM